MHIQKFASEISHDLSSVLVGLWMYKCNLNRHTDNFKSPSNQFTQQSLSMLHLSRTPHALTKVKRKKKQSLRFFSFYANKWSRNIIIIEFITFFIFFASQYFSFTLSLATHDIIPPHKTWKFPCFFLFFANFFLLFSDFFNICRWMYVYAVCEPGGKTCEREMLNNFPRSTEKFCCFMIQEVLTHHFPSMRMGLKAILGKKRTLKVKKTTTCSLISLGICLLYT